LVLLFGPIPAVHVEFTQLYANTFGSQVESQEYAIKVQEKEIEVPSYRESHESVVTLLDRLLRATSNDPVAICDFY
jgi:hypothetical protein